MNRDSHVSDEEMMLAIDGELDEPQSTEVSAHVSHCWTCRVRRGELEQAISVFVKVHSAEYGSIVPPGKEAAARLKAQMAGLAQKGRGAWAVPWQGFALALLLLVGTGLSWLGLAWLSGNRASAGPLPDPRLTPGATRLISREQVCEVPADDDGRMVSSGLAIRVFHQYRMKVPKPGAYEVDYLISPALGGADDIRNLWPQPYAGGIWNSRVKDALEDYLRRLVCEGRVDLATAQHEIASDWIAAYRKYFRTGEPVAAHALFVKDRPWE